MMAIRRFSSKRPRLLSPSRILRPTQRRAGGGRDRDELVEEAHEAIARGSKSFAFASRLFDRGTRERAWLLYAWCRRCDDIADGQEFGGKPGDPVDAENRIQAIRIGAIDVFRVRRAAVGPAGRARFVPWVF